MRKRRTKKGSVWGTSESVRMKSLCQPSGSLVVSMTSSGKHDVTLELPLHASDALGTTASTSTVPAHG